MPFGSDSISFKMVEPVVVYPEIVSKIAFVKSGIAPVNKYGSVSSSMGTVKYYYQIIRAEVARTGTSERVPEVKFIVDQTTYDALDTGDRTTQTQYEWEDELNDNKRDIKLIDASLIQDIDYAVKRTYAS